MKAPGKIFLVSFLVLVFAAVSALGQEIVLPEGSELTLTLNKELSSKEADRGDTIEFTVKNDVKIEDQIIVKQGTLAKGTVIYAEKGGYLGRSGKLAVQVESTMTTDGQPMPLRAAKGKEGNSATGATMALSMLVGPFGMLKKGGDTVIKEGAELVVYTAEERRFRLDGATLVAVKSETPATTSNEQVTVYIYRPKKMLGGALEPSVYCDGVELARMDNGRFFTLKLAPGRHIIHMTSEMKGYEINMGGGQTYYFRVGIEAGMWKGQGKILLENNDKGTEEVKKIKYLGADKIKDKTLVQPAPAKSDS